MSSNIFGPLISPESLKCINCSVVILDTRPGEEVFASGHLEGAFHADLNLQLSTASQADLDPAKGGRHPLPKSVDWSTQLGLWGIGPETFVVAYDGASGANGACRLWWMIRSLGHTRVAVLDGTLQDARKVGLVFTEGNPAFPVEAEAPYPCTVWQWPTIDMVSIEKRLRDPNWKVLDVRARERWLGNVEPIDPVAGRIPGTVNLPFSENLGPDGRYKSPELLREMYQNLLAGNSAEFLAVHCGSGVTACHTLLALELAGLHGACLYVGSYSEWCRNNKPLGRG